MSVTPILTFKAGLCELDVSFVPRGFSFSTYPILVLELQHYLY